MTTATEQIAELIAGYTDLKQFFQNKKDVINQAVNDAIAAIPELSRTYYVDQTNGNDDNDGTSPSTAFQSFSKVFSVVGKGISLTIVLVSDYIESNTRHLFLGTNLEIKSHTSRRRLEFKSYVWDGSLVVSGIRFVKPADVLLTNLNIKAKNYLPNPINSASYLRGFIHSWATYGPSRLSLSITDCGLEVDNGFYVMGFTSDKAQHKTLYVRNTAFATMAGRWVAHVPAGQNPANELSHLTTNLSSL